MPEKPILAFDCSTPAASVALSLHGAVHVRGIENGKQAAELVSAIDDLLGEHRIKYGDLGAIITTIGPGSFTGLRIALATLHGLVLAVPTPIKTITSLEAVAWEVAHHKNPPLEIRVVLNAGKGEVFSQSFSLQGGMPKALDTIAMVHPDMVDTTLPMFGNTQESTSAYYIVGPSAAILCEVANLLPATHINDALPLYIRAPDAKIPTPLPWLIKEAV